MFLKVTDAIADDLNPLYVYEAKMSLFVRMAQTRLGAERLLETQLILILSQCDYLDVRPEADQSFMGNLTSSSLAVTKLLHRPGQLPSFRHSSAFHARSAIGRRDARDTGHEARYGVKPGITETAAPSLLPNSNIF